MWESFKHEGTTVLQEFCIEVAAFLCVFRASQLGPLFLKDK